MASVMRWLADECIAARIVTGLRESGHDVTYMAEMAPSTTDVQAIDRAWREKRLLLTEDKDFGELVFRQGRPVPGVVLLRISADRASQKWNRLEAAIGRFGTSLAGRYTVIEDTRLRSRPLELRF
jgi:predicted nuclease of predicted toxin-antitoxin system